MSRLKTLLFLWGNLILGIPYKIPHSKAYKEIKKEITDLTIPTQYTYKTALKQDRNKIVNDLKTAFEKK